MGKNNTTKRMEWILPIVAIAVFAGFFLFRGSQSWLTSERRSGPHALIGTPAPEINFFYESGESGSLSKGKGRVYLLNFWASWCEPCMAEMPSLRALENHLSPKGFVLLAFNIGETSDRLKGQLKGKDFPTNVIFEFDRSSLRPYSVQALPVSVLIGKDGIVKRVYEGQRNWTDLRYLKEIQEELP